MNKIIIEVKMIMEQNIDQNISIEKLMTNLIHAEMSDNCISKRVSKSQERKKATHRSSLELQLFHKNKNDTISFGFYPNNCAAKKNQIPTEN